MDTTPVIAVFDAGKTNKKMLLFDEQYRIVYEKIISLHEVIDEDGFPCEDISALSQTVNISLQQVLGSKEFAVKAVNFAAYGASLVYIGANGQPVCPLYNYLKPYPDELSTALYNSYGGEEEFSLATSSPALGSLNSGLQLYRLKAQRPDVFKSIKYALHLPQYLSFLFTGQAFSELASIGCHTAMWDFNQNNYHNWIVRENIGPKLPPVAPANTTVTLGDAYCEIKAGIGIHDSSAALLPYLKNFKKPFALISTGTWSISFNPFNSCPLTAEELNNDCLCYMQYNGIPVKASRVFLGFEYEQQVNRIAGYFCQDAEKYNNTPYDPAVIARLRNENHFSAPVNRRESAFGNRQLSQFRNDMEAFHCLVMDIVDLQVWSTNLVLTGAKVSDIFVDGGFSRNEVYMTLLAAAYPDKKVFAAEVPCATALGAALVIHKSWNNNPLPQQIMALRPYS